jgi:hypothetical protein
VCVAIVQRTTTSDVAVAYPSSRSHRVRRAARGVCRATRRQLLSEAPNRLCVHSLCSCGCHRLELSLVLLRRVIGPRLWPCHALAAVGSRLNRLATFGGGLLALNKQHQGVWTSVPRTEAAPYRPTNREGGASTVLRSLALVKLSLSRGGIDDARASGRRLRGMTSTSTSEPEHALKGLARAAPQADSYS